MNSFWGWRKFFWTKAFGWASFERIFERLFLILWGFEEELLMELTISFLLLAHKLAAKCGLGLQVEGV